MELVEGEPLDRRIPPSVPLADFFGLALPLADALAAAHDRGVTHRDLKPANIIVRPDGRARWSSYERGGRTSRLLGYLGCTRTDAPVRSTAHATRWRS